MSPSVMHIEAFYDPGTGTFSYVLADPASGHAAVIDPVLDFEPRSGTLGSAASDRLVAFIRERGWQLQWILETHAHADHLSGAQYLRHHLGGRVAIGARIREVQQVFSGIFAYEPGFRCDGSQFDHLFEDGETFQVGGLQVQALWVPGHTPADMAYRVGDAVFVGDTLFMPDVGTARCDFPGGDAATLYRSIRRLLALPPATRLFVCHDYPPQGREPAWESTVAAQRRANVHVHDGVDETAFVQRRMARDATLDMPTLMLPAVQANVRAGRLPPAHADGRSYLQLPVNAFAAGADHPPGVWTPAVD